MNTQEIKNRIKKCEDELAELRNELEPKPVTWKEVFKRNEYFFDRNWNIGSCGFYTGDFPNLPTKASMKKMLTYGKLLALQQRLGAGVYYLWNSQYGLAVCNTDTLDGRVGFKEFNTAKQAIDIFKANGDEQELIDFLK